MKCIDIYDLRDEIELLSTGLTEELSSMQDEFHRLFEYVEQKAESLNKASTSEDVWEYTEDLWADKSQKQRLFEKIKDIVTIPSYKYVFQYLLLKYCLYIERNNLKDFWAYLESENWIINENISIDEINQFKEHLLQKQTKKAKLQADSLDTDYHMLLSVITCELKQEYGRNGLDPNINWVSYFTKIMYRFDLKQLNELALVLQMDYSYYRIFRKKVLKLGEINYYNRENILLYLVLNYANPCGIENYVQAYHSLKELYPQKMKREEKTTKSVITTQETKTKKQLLDETFPTTTVIGQLLHNQLEDSNGQLKDSFCASLFEYADPNIAHIFEMVDVVSRKANKRSAERIFLEQWQRLDKHIFQYERKVILEKVRQDKKNEVSEVSYVGKQKIYRWLYGMNVYRREKNRNVDLKDKEMIPLGDGSKDYLLNSKIFLETRIRDNTFSAFPLDEERQRNLLLTVGFLNFVLESERGGYLAENYSDRLVDFEIYMYKLFAPCGFMLPHSGNAYDAYLKLLLSCDAPVELFRDIWRMKTGSLE